MENTTVNEVDVAKNHLLAIKYNKAIANVQC